jgi:hypothetical protein
MNEGELSEAYALLDEVEAMQWDVKLPWHQRKMANDADKLLLTQPCYPFIPAGLVSDILSQIKSAKEYIAVQVQQQPT